MLKELRRKPIEEVNACREEGREEGWCDRGGWQIWDEGSGTAVATHKANSKKKMTV